MARPLIGITTYPENSDGRFDLPVAYVAAIRRAGADAVLLPPGALEPTGLVGRLDGLVLSGGGDLDPAIYGGRDHPTIYGLDPERDADELALARWLVAERFPTLAICRGMQVMNVALGGRLNAHLPDEAGEHVLHRHEPAELRGMPAPTQHRVAVDPGLLADVMGDANPEPMSWHHQAVVHPGDGMRVVARAPDGTIEATEHVDHPDLLAVQWHPELSAIDDPTQQRLFDWLVTRAR